MIHGDAEDKANWTTKRAGKRRGGECIPGKILFFGLLCLCCAAASQNDSPQSRDVFLATQGYGKETHILLCSWNEAPRSGGGELVNGYRLKPRDGGQPFDLYARENALLTPQDLHRLGIHPKTWGRPGTVQSPAAPAPPEKHHIRASMANIPPALSHGLLPVAQLLLPELDDASLRAEDDKKTPDREKGLPRIGVFQDFPEPVSLCSGIATHGAWQFMPDGKYRWSIEIIAPEALGQRIQFTSLNLPAGGLVFIYPAKKPQEALGPFTALPERESELWTPTCFSEHCIVECQLPAEAQLAQACLQIPRIAYIYRSSAEAFLKSAGACNIDVACEPAWAEVALGVGGLGVISSPNVLFCTCTLITDLDEHSDLPYVLTANHCVRGQTGLKGASNLEFYWFFQTPSCNASPPSLASVPRTTGGADYLAGMTGTGREGGGNDFTLLRMRNQPPTAAGKAGWTVAVPPLGTPVTAIHHPRGSFKRISFGQLTSLNNPHSQYYHESLWNQGTTEPGSSGCPLMLTATQQIIGQLWGGDASCEKPDQPDYFGRFDVTYAIIAEYLSPPMAGFADTAVQLEEGSGIHSLLVILNQPARENGGAVDIARALGSATDSDIVAVTPRLEFSPGQHSAAVFLEIAQDTHFEPPETFYLSLQNSLYLLLDAPNATVAITIIDDDPDADGDGLSDEDERMGVFGFVSDPALPDTDGDGIPDGEEVFGIRGYVTDPGNPDSDDDGLSDGQEYQWRLNPLDSSDGASISSLRIPWFVVHQTQPVL